MKGFLSPKIFYFVKFIMMEILFQEKSKLKGDKICKSGISIIKQRSDNSFSLEDQCHPYLCTCVYKYDRTAILEEDDCIQSNSLGYLKSVYKIDTEICHFICRFVLRLCEKSLFPVECPQRKSKLLMVGQFIMQM